MLRKTLIVAALLVVLAAAGAWAGGSLLLHLFHRPWEGVAPAQGIEPVSFPASDGVDLKGWWWPGTDSTRAVVLLHGIGADRLQMLPRATWLHEAGYSVLLFDFRGSGESGGHGTLGFAERFDVEGALKFLREKKAVRQTAIVAQSMGAAAAVMAVERWADVRGAVLEGLYDRLENAIRARVRRRVGWLEPVLSPFLLWQVRPRLGFRPEDLAPVKQIGKAKCPVLLGYGGKDRTVSPQTIRDLFAAGPYPTTLWVLQLAGHEDLYHFDPAAYKAKIGEFLRQALGQPVAESVE
jgi:pimeloyl-ACP methyl ester carboxylesterase